MKSRPLLYRTICGGSHAAVVLFLLVACSSQQVYESSQGWRQNECGNIVDAVKNEACLREANKPWSQYEQDRKSAEKK